ncbi:class I SAM-dependent methyltransferase [Mycolicibacterium thermoresistibile]|jgi:methylation protein EvaC|uniref:C-methyltransferase n=2 Tax=Mycolicibacterium thermoresistibile TaxID=1797 RepID=G7CEG3_MYCT3|nr:class I SAM-dependent methyltransferase [Mycolicibacterium thermoresistibile]EHI13630.1 c-methyltransferase [Mycolicibacterium thermoresistibile ATCC 19527]MCV7186753.1 class I SAM-dependent methyltransferase [Mycolicibacterium thermoresistibile]GAT17629.1 methyltransferase domain-containing protein [Mycolicibacterium thermoresistibile]SNW20749.1 methyltransferase [Mycolicibacterium thermoresistibile]
MADHRCRICNGVLREVLDLGRQPVSNAFALPEDADKVPFFRLAMGVCTSCTMVQQLETVPPSEMYRADYPYRASGSMVIRRHFEQVARQIVENCPGGRDGFVVEIGSNDGVMLKTLSAAGMRHLGVDPAAGAGEVARAHGVNVRTAFFNADTAAEIHSEHGPANLIFSANTFSHISYLDSIFKGVDHLLAPDGLFVFEDRSLADILRNNYFDQIYDEHIYLFSVSSVQAMAAHFGFELVDVEHLPLHGGSIRYIVARKGVREPAEAVAEFLAGEREQGLGGDEAFTRFADQIARIKTDLVSLLADLRDEGRRVVGYGATSRSATVLNYCGIGRDLLPMVCDSTPEKQGRVTPGSRIPVCPPDAFADPYPDYALLFAWNHAEEIMAKETEFTEKGGRWILYTPQVHTV